MSDTLTLPEAARLCGCDSTTLSRWDRRGRFIPHDATRKAPGSGPSARIWLRARVLAWAEAGGLRQDGQNSGIDNDLARRFLTGQFDRKTARRAHRVALSRARQTRPKTVVVHLSSD
jgi:hypothetical protein